MKKVTIMVAENELLALEDTLMVWNLCKKHKAKTWTPKTRQLSDPEIFKMQDECKSCKKYNRELRNKSIAVMGRLFSAYDKQKSDAQNS